MNRSYSFILLVGCVVGLATAQLYVSPDGSDSSGDGTLAKPFRSIGHAVDIAGPTPTTITLAEGKYFEDKITITGSITVVGKSPLTTTISHTGSPNGIFQIKSGNASTIVNISGVHLDKGDYGIKATQTNTQPFSIKIENCKFSKYDEVALLYTVDPQMATGSTQLAVTDCEFYENDKAVKVNAEAPQAFATTYTFTRCTFRDNKKTLDVDKGANMNVHLFQSTFNGRGTKNALDFDLEGSVTVQYEFRRCILNDINYKMSSSDTSKATFHECTLTDFNGDNIKHQLSIESSSLLSSEIGEGDDDDDTVHLRNTTVVDTPMRQPTFAEQCRFNGPNTSFRGHGELKFCTLTGTSGIRGNYAVSDCQMIGNNPPFTCKKSNSIQVTRTTITPPTELPSCVTVT